MQFRGTTPTTGESDHAANSSLKSHLKVGFSIPDQCTTLGWKAQAVAQLQNSLRIGFSRMVVSTPDAINSCTELMVIQEVINAGSGVIADDSSGHIQLIQGP